MKAILLVLLIGLTYQSCWGHSGEVWGSGDCNRLWTAGDRAIDNYEATICCLVDYYFAYYGQSEKEYMECAALSNNEYYDINNYVEYSLRNYLDYTYKGTSGSIWIHCASSYLKIAASSLFALLLFLF